MSDFVTTDLGEMPREWPVRKIGEVFETQLEKMLSQKAHGGDSPKPYLRNKNVQWGRMTFVISSIRSQRPLDDRRSAECRFDSLGHMVWHRG